VRVHVVIGGRGEGAQPPGSSRDSIELRLAKRLLEAQNATVSEDEHGVIIELPIEKAVSVVRAAR
jgi:hypothetical protein